MQKFHDTRKRLVWGALVLCVALVAYSVFSPAPEDRSGAVPNELSRLFRPITSGITWVGSGISSVWNHYFNLSQASIENDKLRQDVAQLRDQALTLQEAQLENQRLHNLLKISASWTRNPVFARVISNSTNYGIRTVIIDRGWADGIERDRPVMADGGLIGRVRVIAEHSSTILLITDPNSSVDVIDARSRVRGLLVGALKETKMRRPVALTLLEYVSQDSNILQKDDLITSGLDGVYPKGLLVGTVHEVRRDDFGLFEEVWVLPSADLSRLEDVIVL